MGFLGLEPVLDLLRAELTAHLPAKLAALEASLAPAMELRAVSEIAIGERANFTDYPAIALGPMWTDVLEDLGQTRLVQGHRATLVLHVTAALEEDLTRLLLRYVRATSEVLAERRDAGAFGRFRLTFDRKRWSYDPIDLGGHQFIRTARIELGGWRAEDLA